MKPETHAARLYQKLKETKQPRLVFMDDVGNLRIIPYSDIVGIYNHKVDIKDLREDITNALNGGSK